MPRFVLSGFFCSFCVWLSVDIHLLLFCVFLFSEAVPTGVNIVNRFKWSKFDHFGRHGIGKPDVKHNGS